MPFCIRIWAIGLLPLLMGPAARAGPTREQIQAALVYKFAQFVQWPGNPRSPDAPVVIGILGSGGIRPALEEAVQGKTLEGRRFEVRVFGRPEEVRDCEILVVDMPESRRGLAMKLIPRKGLLSIGDGASFARQGGIIAVIMEGTRVKFDINLAAAEEAGLTISGAMLGLAHEAGRW